MLIFGGKRGERIADGVGCGIGGGGGEGEQDSEAGEAEEIRHGGGRLGGEGAGGKEVAGGSELGGFPPAPRGKIGEAIERPSDAGGNERGGEFLPIDPLHGGDLGGVGGHGSVVEADENGTDLVFPDVGPAGAVTKVGQGELQLKGRGYAEFLREATVSCGNQ